MIYQGIYKCKLCGELFLDGDTYDTRYIGVPYDCRVNSFAWHFCDDGNIGAGEALGLAKREDLWEEAKWDD